MQKLIIVTMVIVALASVGGKPKKEPEELLSPRSRPSYCELEPEIGMCKALFRYFYFNSKTGKCEVSDFGGCGGNENHFMFREDCQCKCGQNSQACEVDEFTKQLHNYASDRDS